MNFLFASGSLENALAKLFFLLTRRSFNLVSLLSSCEDVLGMCVRFLSE